MKGMDILKTTAAFLLVLVLVSCGGGGDTAATAPGISGHITIGGTYFAGVTVTLSGTSSATTTTNSSGYYSFTGLANGDYVVTPTRTGCTFTPTASPTLTYSGTDITQNFTTAITPAIAAGGNHSLALKSNGTVWAWGYNGYGQLGDGTTTRRLEPVQITGLTGVIAIAAGGNHSLALRGNGTVWAWGLNTNGQLGNGTTTSSSTPVQVSNLSGIAAIAAGGNHSLALTTGGGVKAWGYNASGQLGNGTTTRSSIPLNVSGLTSGVTAIAAGESHSLALNSSGGVKAWGYNGYGQLGDGNVINNLTPGNVSGLTAGIDAIAAGGNHSLALTNAGGVKAWGLNTYGQLGNNTTTESHLPLDVSGLAGMTAIAAGGNHSLALTSTGGIKAWGYNAYGQLGDETTTYRTTPVDVFSLTSGITAITAGESHSLALTNAGGARAWGLNTNGQLGNDSTTNSSTPVNVNSF